MNKKKITSLVAGLALMFGLTTAQAETGLEGAWVSETVTDEDGNTRDAQRGLYVFTRNHYSIMFVNTAEERPMYEGEEQTDAEKLANYDSITANSGRYEVEGNVLTTHAFVAKDTNYMGGWPDNEQTYEFEVDGDKLTIKSVTFPSPYTVTMRQVDGSDFPAEEE